MLNFTSLMLNFTSLRLILCFANTQLIYSIVDPYPPPEPIVQLIVGIVDPCPPPADCCVPLPPSHPSESPTDAPADSPRDAPRGRAYHQIQFEHPPRAPVPQLLPLLRGRPALPREHARPAALAACSLPRRTIPHAVPRASLTSRRAVRPTGRHVQSKFDLSTRRVLLPSHRGRPALPRGHARPAALAACSLPQRTTPANLHLVLTNNRDTPPEGRPEKGRAAKQRDPPKSTS